MLAPSAASPSPVNDRSQPSRLYFDLPIPIGGHIPMPFNERVHLGTTPIKQHRWANRQPNIEPLMMGIFLVHMK